MDECVAGSWQTYARLSLPPSSDLFFSTRVKSRMKRFPSRLSHRDRGDGRRGEAEEAGGRQSKGRTLEFVWLLAQLSDTATNTAKWSFNLLAPLDSSSTCRLPRPGRWLSVPPPLRTPKPPLSQLSDSVNTRPDLTAGELGRLAASPGLIVA